MSTMAFIEDEKKDPMIKIPFCFILFIILFPITQSFAQLDDKVVIFDTKSGRLVIEFFSNDAPNHVENFINLTNSGFYDRTFFHRVIEGFMIQGGDPFTKPGAYDTPLQWGTGDPGYKIDVEFNDIKHNVGIVSMARSNDPNSAGSQFFIVHKDSNFLDGQYTAFGRLATQESYETLEKIATLETAPNDVPLQWGEGEILKSEVIGRTSIPDILDLGDPERVSESTEILDEKYSNKELKISATFPAGWFIQEPEQTVPGTPDVVAVGPLTNGFNPTISITSRATNGTSLDEHIEYMKNFFKAAIDSGAMSILSEEKTTIKGKNSYIMTTDSFFNTTSGIYHVKFKEAIIETPEHFFSITYASLEDSFDKNLQLFENTIDSFEILSEDSNQENNGGCLIATAVFGSELAPQVQQLRETRDNILLNTESGKSFLSLFNQLYYIFSPTIADWERENHIFKESVRITITPLLTSLSILNHVNIDTEVEMLVYGISLILLNVGIYFVAPAYVFYKLKKIKSTKHHQLHQDLYTL